ncbi:Transposon Tf2-7 polyprotein [Rhizoctonia solani]|uniref:Transposon Tf2-7 polyprotein n=1 Tax=Rhizoctonia solani TaxID=456999 RepID=A0A8H8PD61_9AGAM|nr:Transposon Tf2-7 polyprotein [Rhizoctonia solani]QRW27801.1 Transposon Tf2-7 polyprotein [Rhizoctonia solani]
MLPIVRKFSKGYRNKLYCQLEKCRFFQDQVHYLGIIANGEGVCADPEKISKAVDWATPQTVKGVQEFLGFVNFYRRFIMNFSKLAYPLYQLLRKENPWKWEFFLECDASDYATGAILSQKGGDDKLHPVAFLSKSLSPAECNYDIYDKELLASSQITKTWNISKQRGNLTGAWLPKQKADILSRREDLKGEAKGGGEAPALIAPELFISSILTDSDLNDLIRDALPDDKTVAKILKSLEENIPVKGWSLDNGLLYYHQCIYVPNEPEIRRLVLESRHDNPSTGHPGQWRTMELLSRHYYWSGMKQSVAKYIQACDSCIRSNIPTRQRWGYSNLLIYPESLGGNYI